MNFKERLSSYPKQILMSLLAITVFCFWYFLYPHLLLMRESSQLFLWNRDYLMERMMTVGGFSQYVGEFLVQFFYHPFYGALIYAALFVIAQQLTRRLFQRLPFLLTLIPSLILWGIALHPYIPLTTTVAILLVMLLATFLPLQRTKRVISIIILLPIAYWLAGPGDYYWEEEHPSTMEEMRCDYMIRHKDWRGITSFFTRHPSTSPAIQHAVRLASYQQGIIREQDLYHTDLFSNNALRSEVSSFIMDEIYLQLGLVNMSQRATFEAMESIPNHQKSGRALKRLAETSIITRQYTLALKYLDILQETTFYRPWALRTRLLAEDPQRIRQYPLYLRLQEVYDKTQDRVFY